MIISLQATGSEEVVTFKLTEEAKKRYQLVEGNPDFTGKLLSGQLRLLVEKNTLVDFQIGKTDATETILSGDQACVMAEPGRTVSKPDIAKASVELGKALGSLELVLESKPQKKLPTLARL